MQNTTKNNTEEPRTMVKTLKPNDVRKLASYFNHFDSAVEMFDVIKPNTKVKSVTAVIPQEIVTDKKEFDDFKQAMINENGLDAGIYKLEVGKNNKYHLHAIGWDVGDGTDAIQT